MGLCWRRFHRIFCSAWIAPSSEVKAQRHTEGIQANLKQALQRGTEEVSERFRGNESKTALAGQLHKSATDRPASGVPS